jgi:hypothetical protein
VAQAVRSDRFEAQLSRCPLERSRHPIGREQTPVFANEHEIMVVAPCGPGS